MNKRFSENQRVLVVITSRHSKGKQHEEHFTVDDWISARRIANTFEPKRGHKIVRVIMEGVDTLL